MAAVTDVFGRELVPGDKVAHSVVSGHKVFFSRAIVARLFPDRPKQLELFYPDVVDKNEQNAKRYRSGEISWEPRESSPYNRVFTKNVVKLDTDGVDWREDWLTADLKVV